MNTYTKPDPAGHDEVFAFAFGWRYLWASQSTTGFVPFNPHLQLQLWAVVVYYLLLKTSPKQRFITAHKKIHDVHTTPSSLYTARKEPVLFSRDAASPSYVTTLLYEHAIKIKKKVLLKNINEITIIVGIKQITRVGDPWLASMRSTITVEVKKTL